MKLPGIYPEPYAPPQYPFGSHERPLNGNCEAPGIKIPVVFVSANYILDDEKAFKAFLKNGRIELSNSAAERMFRHIAMGRRNWLHSGSHDAAQNIAFMYSLYESCKLNDLNFFDYINDVLTRLMKGETDYKSLIPCNYKPLPKDNGEGQKEAA